MATQTRFDLTAATEIWRSELAAQPQLSPDDRRELEKHLTDSMAELHQRGLSDEESFWLARRRIGQPQQLAAEFIKVNPDNVWQERAFWMALALVVSYVYRIWADVLMISMDQFNWAAVVYFITLAIPLAVLLGTVILIRRRSIPIQNRYSFWKLACGLLILLAATFSAAFFRGRHLPNNNLIAVGYNVGLIESWVDNAVWPVVMVLMVLLTQELKRKIPKSA